MDEQKVNKEVDRLVEEQFEKTLLEKMDKAENQNGISKLTYSTYFESLLRKPLFLLVSFIPGLLMYVLLLIGSNSYIKYIFERLIMSIFVIIGVAILVFTILYMSPV